MPKNARRPEPRMAATPADEFDTAAGRVPLPPWPFLETLPAVLQASADPVAGFRAALAAGTDSLRQRLEDDEGGDGQREGAMRLGVNLVLYALCLDYKDDQVHSPFIMRRRAGQP